MIETYSLYKFNPFYMHLIYKDGWNYI